MTTSCVGIGFATNPVTCGPNPNQLAFVATPAFTIPRNGRLLQHRIDVKILTTASTPTSIGSSRSLDSTQTRTSGMQQWPEVRWVASGVVSSPICNDNNACTDDVCDELTVPAPPPMSSRPVQR